MKKLLSLFFLTIFLFNTAGYFILFKLMQLQVKKEIAMQIKSKRIKKELSVITINKTDLANINWIEEGKEMRFQNKFYDVVDFSETENTFIFYCIDDAEEELLFAGLNNYIEEEDAENKPYSQTKKAADHFVKLFLSDDSSLHFLIDIKTNLFSTRNILFQSVYIENNSPPPEFS